MDFTAAQELAQEEETALTEAAKPKTCVTVNELSLYYGQKRALTGINLSAPANKVTALIGPSGCGKSTLLRCFNRMNDLIDNVRVEGRIVVEGVDVCSRDLDVTELRKRVGMVFQKSIPFPKSIFENVAYGLRLHGFGSRAKLEAKVEKSLRAVALWEEVKDRLYESAMQLSGGQQQRLCIARAIAIEPQVLLMDEPCSALDPIATSKIEELIYELKSNYSILIVTHNMQQAARVADFTGFMLMGELIEFAPTERIFQNPERPQTLDYVTGRFG